MLGEQLQNLRKKAGMSMEEVAKKSGIAYTTIYNIERGIIATSPKTETVAKIFDALGYKVQFTLTKKEEPENE